MLGTPVIALTLMLLAAERIFGIGIFDAEFGGDPVLFQHFFLVLFASCCLHYDTASYGNN